MVITILEAHVAEENVMVLQETFKNAVKQLDAGIVQTTLLRGIKDTSNWHIMTVWESRSVLDAMRQSGVTPRGILIFRAAKAEPALTMFDVVEQGLA
jgi:heme-degrading monooxygenase HmoA